MKWIQVCILAFALMTSSISASASIARKEISSSSNSSDCIATGAVVHLIHHVDVDRSILEVKAEVKTYTVEVRGGTPIRIIGTADISDDSMLILIPYIVSVSASPGRSASVIISQIKRSYHLQHLGTIIVAPLREGVYHYTVTGRVSGVKSDVESPLQL